LPDDGTVPDSGQRLSPGRGGQRPRLRRAGEGRLSPRATAGTGRSGSRLAIMSSTAERDDPALWDKIKQAVTAGGKGGAEGEWSARKAQLAVAEYKKQGGGYKGGKDPHNSLHEWTEEKWGTKSGKRSGETHERYLPEKARDALSDADYDRTTAKKRADAADGKQFSAQPDDVAAKTKPFRDHRTKTELYREAKKRDVPGRSTMSKADLIRALG
jgi:hypothetical protein